MRSVRPPASDDRWNHVLCAQLLQSRYGMLVFPVDHPGLPRCIGAHRPDQPYYDENGKHQRGKHPLGRWSRDATTDPDVIRLALSRGLRNVGIACGPSGLLVVDEDRPGAYAAYAAEVGQVIEQTFTVITAKGRHLYYRQPAEPLGNSPGALAGRGIDIRGKGGFVLAPGSVHETGVQYELADPAAPILPAPGWLVTALRSSRPLAAAARPRRTNSRTGEGRPFKVLTGLVQTVLDATPGTDRNTRLYWAACRAFEHAGMGLFPADGARAALLDAARHIGLSDGEAEATLDSAKTMTGGTK